MLNRYFDPSGIAITREKYHRARLSFDDLKRDFLEFGCPKANRSHTNAYYMVLQSLIEDLKPAQKVIPTTRNTVYQLSTFPGTKSPGLPYKNMGYKTKRDAIEDENVRAEIDNAWNRIGAGHRIELPDTAVYARAQICTRDKNKVRATWGYPLSVYAQEGTFFYPLLEAISAHPHPIFGYGIEMGTGGMEYINNMVSEVPHTHILLGDWSRFDKTIPPWLVRDSFRILETWIDFGHIQHSDGSVTRTNPHRALRQWKAMVNYFIDTPCRLSNGERFIKHGGVPSGTCFTNMIDSMVNAIVMRYLVYEMTGRLPVADIYFGDDSVVVLHQSIDMTIFKTLAYQNFSMIFNDDKSHLTTNLDNVHFLGFYNDQGKPTRGPDVLIASSIYPERTVQNKLESVVRLIGEAYSCFEPTDVRKFFSAAWDLMLEDKLDPDFVVESMDIVPETTKYMRLNAYDMENIRIPRPNASNELIFLTQPSAPRKRYKHKYRDADEIYLRLLESEVTFQDDTSDESSNDSSHEDDSEWQ